MKADTDRQGEARDRYRETERQRQDKERQKEAERDRQIEKQTETYIERERCRDREEMVSLRPSFVTCNGRTVVRPPKAHSAY